MKNFIASTITIALMTAAPASAQLLGGSGGLGGSLGGTLGTDTIGRTAGSVAGRGGVTSSTRVDRTVDIRSGKIATDTESSANANGSLIGAADLPNNAVSGSADGSASGNANGGVSANLVGTDTLRSTSGQVVGTTRYAAGRARSTANGVVSNVANSASGVGSFGGSAAGQGNGMAMGDLGQLAASGSAAANAGGMFTITPGMPIQDAKGRMIGQVQSVRSTGAGVVKSVIVEAGNRTAELPAANFAGSGDVLVTAMSKGELKKAAKAQSQASENESAQ